MQTETTALDTFFAKLAATAKIRPFFLNEYGAIRRIAGIVECPLTSVVNSERKSFLPLFYYDYAARELGIDEFRPLIVSAADNDGDCNKEIRNRLLEACKLPVATQS
jgi:hypothetical protein